MLYNRKFDRALILIVPAALFVYMSARPHVRLRAEMPAEFVDVQTSADPARQDVEQKLAQQYWNCALALIQWKYTYGTPLPDIPPEEFRIKSTATPGSESAASVRLRYWNRLRKVWLLPSAWTTTRAWSTDWLTNSLKHGLERVEDFFKDLFGQR